MVGSYERPLAVRATKARGDITGQTVSAAHVSGCGEGGRTAPGCCGMMWEVETLMVMGAVGE